MGPFKYTLPEMVQGDQFLAAGNGLGEPLLGRTDFATKVLHPLLMTSDTVASDDNLLRQIRSESTNLAVPYACEGSFEIPF